MQGFNSSSVRGGDSAWSASPHTWVQGPPQSSGDIHLSISRSMSNLRHAVHMTVTILQLSKPKVLSVLAEPYRAGSRTKSTTIKRSI